MSHSVFRDLDEDKCSSGIGSKGDVADNNLIVFIDKDDDVRVNSNALQDFIGMCPLSQTNIHSVSISIAAVVGCSCAPYFRIQL